ncbi:MAG: HesB/IscA family protein [Planctomycetota bacterium]|jgi:iron-sulfur cluster assembly accessory protein
MPSITITDRAARKGTEMLAQEEGFENPGLRVKIIGGGCSGLSYRMAFESGPAEGDEVFEHGGFLVFVDKKSLFFLNGSELDYVDALTGAGFRFQNPNVKGTCGCGESFSV